MSSISRLALRARSIRRFDTSQRVDYDLLLQFIDNARMASSARNGQTLKYLPIVDAPTCDKVFATLKFAAYLTDWHGPAEDERPAAYIIVLHDASLGPLFPVDAGLATQNIVLSAAEAGLGCCIVGAVDKQKLAETIGRQYETVHVIAIGRPAEQVVIEPMQGGDIKYWRDAQGTHHVPKRSLDEIVVKL